jgi:UDP-galactopyranose mutase
MKFDYLIVGAGLFGSVFANQMSKRGFSCLVIEKRNHIGGNCWSEFIDRINCHKYGPHVFHTNKKEIWDFVNSITPFYSYISRIKSSINGCLYSFPINLMTFQQLWGITKPEEARAKIEKLKTVNCENNIESWIISQIGIDLYKLFYEGYSTKQWGISPKDVPAFIAKRIPIRYDFNDNYYFDNYQGLPIGGYQELFNKLLDGITVQCNTDYFLNRDYFDNVANKIIFTGKIDEYYNYRFGPLEYRGLDFNINTYQIDDFQGCSIVNYPNPRIPFTRSVEYKHFDNNIKLKNTVVIYEIPKKANDDDIPYYPVNNAKNNNNYKKYNELSLMEKSVVFGGRVGGYVYLDMDAAIEMALKLVKEEIATQTA